MSSKDNEVASDDESDIEEEQLDEYREMVQDLGSFPDKVKINSLSSVAEDFADSKKHAQVIYNCLREPLISPSVDRDRKIPLVFAVDSIIKNAKGQYVPIIEADVKNWMPVVYDILGTRQRETLKKVWNIWRRDGVFAESAWREMGTCFTSAGLGRLNADQSKTSAGISRLADGTLQLRPALRKQMQSLLDEAQSDVQNELEKVSLERLAEINPNLFVNIRKEAETMLNTGSANNNHASGRTNGAQEAALPPFFTETRSGLALKRSKQWIAEWDKPSLKGLALDDLVTKLDEMVQNIPVSGTLYTQKEAIQMTNCLGGTAAAFVCLSEARKALAEQEDKMSDNNKRGVTNILTTTRSTPGLFQSIDRSQFTNDGVKKKVPTVIAWLYEVGLPFVSSVDGRRFKSQLELSQHLDYLFKKKQLEKTMDRTEERGWYKSDAWWTGQSQNDDTNNQDDIHNNENNMAGGNGSTSTKTKTQQEADPSTFTVPADESRDKCAICDINFKMVFDNDEGIYKYINCKEIGVVTDDVAMDESEQMLVHVTCWRNLGSPTQLTMDQVLDRNAH